MTDVKTIRVIPSEIVTSAGTGQTTLRGTSAGLPYNANLLKRLLTIIANEAYDSNLFDNDGFVPEEVTLEDLQKLLTQVIIRFDNDPDYYTKRDYQYLLWYLCNSLIYCTSGSADNSEELEALADALEELQTRVNGLYDCSSDINQIKEDITSIKSDIASIGDDIELVQSDIKSLHGYTTELRNSVDKLTGAIEDHLNRLLLIEKLIADVNGNVTAVQTDVLTLKESAEQSINQLSGAIGYVQNDILDIREQLDNLDVEDVQYEAGSGIEFDENQINSIIGAEIIPNFSVGGIKAGESLDSTMTMTEFLLKLLVKVVDYKSLTSPSIVILTTAEGLEYGSNLKYTVTVTLKQGEYKSEDTSILANRATNCDFSELKVNIGVLPMSVPLTSGSYTAAHSGTILNFASPKTFQATVVVSEDNGDALMKSDGSTPSKLSLYEGGTLTSNSVTITPIYKWFIGEIDIKNLTPEQINSKMSALTRDNLDSWPHTGDLDYNPTSKTVLASGWTSSDSMAPIIACPVDYKLDSVLDTTLSSPIKEQFDSYTLTIQLKCGGVTKAYNLYLNPVTSKTCAFKNVKFVKA